MFKQKSIWAQLGMGTKARDGNGTSAPVPVSEDAQAKNTGDARRELLMEFAPLSQDRSQLLQRPSTSAGPASCFTKRNNAEKGETKDDLHFNPLAAHGKRTTFYNFPLPGALPTPVTTPRSSPPPPKAELARPSTPDSIEIAPVNMDPPPMEIGMALGSPAHPPTIHQPEPTDAYHEYIRNSSPEHVDRSNDGSLISPPMLRRKTSRWKTLGGLFGGKKTTQSFYQLQPEVPQPPPVPVDHYVHFDENQQSDKSSIYRGRMTSERKSKKNKPDMKRANTAPLNFDLADQNRYQNQTPEITLEGERLGDSGPTHTTHSGVLLDIDIPSIQMERYSIMFSGVLQKSGSSTTTSSLLARRQATLDKLKTVNEAIALKEQELYAATRQRTRRASSPQAKSPAFSLFPSTPSRAREPSPSPYRANLQRSNTSPATLSPARPSFAPGPENDGHAQILAAAAEAATREDTEKRRVSAEVRIPNLRRKAPEPTPEPVKEAMQGPAPEETIDSPTFVSPNPKWSIEESRLTLDSPGDELEEFEVEDTYNPTHLLLKPVLPEPHWQMIAPAHGHVPTSSTSGSATSRSDYSTSTSASSIITSPNVASPQPLKQSQGPPKGRARAATTTGAAPNTGRMRSATTSSASNVPHRNPHYIDEDEQLRLKTAADVSIARQISVSRSQRQLLVPIRSALKQPKNPNLQIEQRDFPAPASGIGTISVGRVASPLGAVAVAAQEERERGENPPTDRRERSRPREVKTAERLFEGVKPITPTLVIVGNSRGEKEELWQGATQQHLAHSTPVCLAERRRGNNNGLAHLSTTGEIKVGLAVDAVQAKELQNRKSERVIVERISVASK